MRCRYRLPIGILLYFRYVFPNIRQWVASYRVIIQHTTDFCQSKSLLFPSQRRTRTIIKSSILEVDTWRDFDQVVYIDSFRWMLAWPRAIICLRRCEAFMLRLRKMRTSPHLPGSCGWCTDRVGRPYRPSGPSL